MFKTLNLAIEKQALYRPFATFEAKFSATETLTMDDWAEAKRVFQL